MINFSTIPLGMNGLKNVKGYIIGVQSTKIWGKHP
jgi:hypothetical protein